VSIRKSNLNAVKRLEKLTEFFNCLERISQFFHEESEHPTQDKQSIEEYYNHNFQISHVQDVKNDFQYAFLALRGHDLILGFISNLSELRQQSIRHLFFAPRMEKKSAAKDQYAKLILAIYKKFNEILIKFIYQNHTNKQ